MALAMLVTDEEQLVSTAVLRALGQGVSQGQALLLVPSFSHALLAQKALAAHGGLSLGVEVTTPRAWVRDRWDVWGDGRRVADGAARTLVMTDVAQAHVAGGEQVVPGVVQLLCQLARGYLPWLPDALAREGTSLTAAEREAVALLGAYEDALAEYGLVEGCVAAERLPSLFAAAGVALPAVVAAGFDELPLSERALLVGLARHTEVALVASEQPGVAYEPVRALRAELACMAQEQGVPCHTESVAPVGHALQGQGALCHAGSDVSATRMPYADAPCEAEDKSATQHTEPVAAMGRASQEWGAPAVSRAAELDALLRALFEPGAPRVAPAGTVRLLEPAGPLAEAELVARSVSALVAQGARDVVVAVPDVRRAWRELAPKLAARGMAVRAELLVPVPDTQAGRAYMGYARTVAALAELAATWPAAQETDEGEVRRLGSMAWWPPQELADFLLCDVAHVEGEKARALSVQWRGDRLLAPADVLAHLLSAKATSDAVERATRELLRGRLGSAASKLLAPYVGRGGKASRQDAQASGPSSSLATRAPQGSHVPSGPSITCDHPAPPAPADALAREETVAALTAILGVAGILKELGFSADPAADGHIPLSELVERAERVLATTNVTLRPCLGTDGRATVRLLERSQAALLPAGSADALVACGLSSEELPVPTADDACTGLLQALRLEPEADPLAAQRLWYAHLLCVPRQALLLERPRFSAAAQETYPAVMLTETLACYEAELPRATLAEDAARANLAYAGTAPAAAQREPVAPSGAVDERLRRLVTVPQEGRAELPGGLPVLSASQLESYLECPLKWFSLRRLRLRDNDAGFSPLEMGTFAHRVMELAHAQLLAEACAAAGLEAGEPFDPTLRLPGSRATAADEQGLAHARAVVDACFSQHAAHQHMRVGSRTAYQALIAHNAAQEGQMDRLRRDLVSTVDYEAARLAGFEPRLFEWEFGRGKDHVSYAGVRVTGTVDRVDVNVHGQALVIDYKHKGPAGFFGEYAVFEKGGHGAGEPLALPRRIQALLYAQVVRRAFPGLRVVGALYLGTRGGHELSGAVSENQAENVLGPVSAQRLERVAVPDGETFGCTDGARGMDALLDATEQGIAAQVERLRAGGIAAEPADAAACSYCPVLNCERRLR